MSFLLGRVLPPTQIQANVDAHCKLVRLGPTAEIPIPQRASALPQSADDQLARSIEPSVPVSDIAAATAKFGRDKVGGAARRAEPTQYPVKI
jgi:hypothetical protein